MCDTQLGRSLHANTAVQVFFTLSLQQQAYVPSRQDVCEALTPPHGARAKQGLLRLLHSSIQQVSARDHQGLPRLAAGYGAGLRAAAVPCEGQLPGDLQ